MRHLLRFLAVSMCAGIVAAGLAIPVAGTTAAALGEGMSLFDAMPAEFDDRPLAQPSTLLTKDGKEFATFSWQNRDEVALDQVSQAMQDATLAIAGRRVPVTFKSPDGIARTIAYAVPNKNQCKECHSLKGEIVPIGPKANNLEFGAARQRPDFARFFSWPAMRIAPMPKWDDPRSGSLQDRARAYLAVNCSHCHNPEGSASNSGLFLRWTDPVNVNYGIGKRPTAAGRGSGNMDFAIAPGDPDHSFLIYRLESLDPGIAMPELGRSAVHKEGAALLRQWISEMPKEGG